MLPMLCGRCSPLSTFIPADEATRGRNAAIVPSSILREGRREGAEALQVLEARGGAMEMVVLLEAGMEWFCLEQAAFLRVADRLVAYDRAAFPLVACPAEPPQERPGDPWIA